MVGIDAVLMEGARTVCHAYAVYTMPRRKRDDWDFVLWGRLYNFEVDDAVEDFLASVGITARTETSRRAWWYMSRAGMAYLPMIDAQLGRHRWDDHRRRRAFLPLEPQDDPGGGTVWARPEGC